jgi:anti-anti-sigma regulatory factor
VTEATVDVTGPVTLSEVPRWRDELLAALGEGRPVRLDLSGSGPWDAAGLQLMISAIATGRQAGIPVHLSRVPGAFQAILEQAGAREWLAPSIVS